MRIRLADVAKLDMADRLMRVAKFNDGRITRRVIVSAFPNSNALGDRWYDCRTVVESTDGRVDWERHDAWFELYGTRYAVGQALNREVRDVANDILAGES